MSLRPRLRHDRMTVRAAIDHDGERTGLLWRIRGPEANMPKAERRAKDLALAATALAWCPLIGLGVLLASRLLVLRSPDLWLVLGLVLSLQAAALYLDYLLGRPLFRRPRRAAFAGLALVLLFLNEWCGATSAVVTLLPLSLAAGSLLARTIAVQHARWLAEDPANDWEQRDARRLQAARIPRPNLRLVLSCALAVASYEAAPAHASSAEAGSFATLVLLVSRWVLLSLAGHPIRRVLAEAWHAVVLWPSYNHHESYGPQTFQFEKRCRRPVVRRVFLWAATALLAATVVCVTSAPPWEGVHAIASVVSDPPILFQKTWPQLDRPSAEFQMSPEEEHYRDLLPTEEERRRCRESLTRRAMEQDRVIEQPQQGGGGSLADNVRTLVLAVCVPPLLFFTMPASNQATRMPPPPEGARNTTPAERI